jgi:hypothetical protein
MDAGYAAAPAGDVKLDSMRRKHNNGQRLRWGSPAHRRNSAGATDWSVVAGDQRGSS